MGYKNRQAEFEERLPTFFPEPIKAELSASAENMTLDTSRSKYNSKDWYLTLTFNPSTAHRKKMSIKLGGLTLGDKKGIESWFKNAKIPRRNVPQSPPSGKQQGGEREDEKTARQINSWVTLPTNSRKKSYVLGENATLHPMMKIKKDLQIKKWHQATCARDQAARSSSPSGQAPRNPSPSGRGRRQPSPSHTLQATKKGCKHNYIESKKWWNKHQSFRCEGCNEDILRGSWGALFSGRKFYHPLKYSCTICNKVFCEP